MLSEATFKLIEDPKSKRFRIILLRGDHTAAVCFDHRQYQLLYASYHDIFPANALSVPSDILQESVVHNGSVTKVSRPAWFMDMDEKRIHIVWQESGQDPLGALSKRCKQSIEITFG